MTKLASYVNFQYIIKKIKQIKKEVIIIFTEKDMNCGFGGIILL